MATVPKPAALTAAAPAYSARALSVPSRVAAVSTNQVEALNAGTNISFDAAASGFQQEGEYTQLSREGDRRQKRADPGFDRLFTSNTQVFASIFEDQDKKASVRNTENQAVRSIGRPISSVIKTYESNALVISGQQPVTGTAFSFNL
ncbi:MAG: hypothetical protein WD075_13425 [Rhodospirillales bacterium]